MTFYYNNVYIADTSTVVGPYEKNGPLGKYFDKTYDDLYFKEESFEKAEIKLVKESIDIIKEKYIFTIITYITTCCIIFIDIFYLT